MNRPKTELEPALVAEVICHMNADHPDSVLNIVRHYGGLRDARSAAMTDLSTLSMAIDVDRINGVVTGIEIELPRPIQAPSEIRGILVDMARAARQALEAGASGP